MINAEKDGHKSRFSRAVLAEKRVDLAFSESESYIVVRRYTREPFRYMQHFDRILFRHNISPFLTVFSCFLRNRGVRLGHPCNISGNLIFNSLTVND